MSYHEKIMGLPYNQYIERQAAAEIAAEADAMIADLLAALEALFSNPHIYLGDLVYQVREREGKGWDGEAVIAWSNAVAAAEAAMKKAKEAA